MPDASSPGRPWAVWFTGLPGSGKSAIAGRVLPALADRAPVLLQMDVLRRRWFPRPTYSDDERRAAYARLVEEAVAQVRAGRAVVIDATAPQAAPRRQARRLVTEAGGRFAEIHVRCSLDTAMAREAARPGGQVMAGLYAKALERRRTGGAFDGLGLVPGVDVPFEEDPQAELVIENDALSLDEAAAQALAFLRAWTA